MILETTLLKFEVMFESFRRRFKDKVPRGGREVGRTEGEEIRDKKRSSPAKRSGGLNAVDR